MACDVSPVAMFFVSLLSEPYIHTYVYKQWQGNEYSSLCQLEINSLLLIRLLILTISSGESQKNILDKSIFDFVFTVPLSKSKRQNAVFVDLLRVFREYFSFVCLSIVALAFTKFQFAGRSTSSLFIFIKFRWDELSHTLGIKEPSKKDKWAQIGQQ